MLRARDPPRRAEEPVHRLALARALPGGVERVREPLRPHAREPRREARAHPGDVVRRVRGVVWLGVRGGAALGGVGVGVGDWVEVV